MIPLTLPILIKKKAIKEPKVINSVTLVTVPGQDQEVAKQIPMLQVLPGLQLAKYELEVSDQN